MSDGTLSQKEIDQLLSDVEDAMDYQPIDLDDLVGEDDEEKSIYNAMFGIGVNRELANRRVTQLTEAVEKTLNACVDMQKILESARIAVSLGNKNAYPPIVDEFESILIHIKNNIPILVTSGYGVLKNIKERT